MSRTTLLQKVRLQSRTIYQTGQEDNPIERCTAGVSDADLKTGQARKDAFRRAAECVADGYCATYGIPPGVCSTVAGPIAEEIANSADAVAQAFANGFQIQGAAGPTIEQRQAWAKSAYGKAVGATRNIHNELFPKDIWTRDLQAGEIWKGSTTRISTQRYQDWIASGKIGQSASRDDGSDGMDGSFFLTAYSLDTPAQVSASVREGLNLVLRDQIAEAAAVKSRYQLGMRGINIKPTGSSTLKKLGKVSAWAAGGWIAWKIVGMLRGR